MAPATPMGAESITILVNLNISLRQALAKGQHGTALFFANQGQRNAKDHAEDHDLQHLAFSHGLGDVFRKDVQDNVSPFLRLRGDAGRCRSTGLWNTHAGLRKIDCPQPNEQRHRGDEFKIKQRLDSHAPDLLQVGMAGDPHHQRAEDERRN